MDRSMLAAFDTQLGELDRRQRRRRLAPRGGLDFASNDYLGLADSGELRNVVVDALARGVPIGSGGSRLLRGNHPEHQLLEEEAAAFFGSECSLLFSSGYAANSTLLSALPQRGDLIVHDPLVHASSREGIRLARAQSRAARHNDVQCFADVIDGWRRCGGSGRPWLVVESLYSMDGDQAPLAELSALADRCGGFLLIDEAHATGVFGTHGRGLAAGLDGRENVIAIRTCGKALGCEGALVCGPRTLIDFLVNRGRGFIFSTAPSPLMAATIRGALAILRSDQERVARLRRLIDHSAALLGPLGARTGSPIMPLIVGEEGATMALASALRERGFDVRGIRPPTVPDGTSRLRISITLNVNEAAVSALADALGGLLE